MMVARRRRSLGAALALMVPLVRFLSWAGGSGLNVAVVVNQLVPDSIELGNYYCEQRGVPPQNLFRLTSWTGGRISWSRADCFARLVGPLTAALADRGLTNQIDYVVLSLGIPYQVTDTNGVNSTTSVLYYGFKPDEGTSPYGPFCTLPPGANNDFVFSEDWFRQVPPGNATTDSFLATMITGDTLAAAKLVVDHGVASDGSFPTQTVWLAQTSYGARSVRHVFFDNTYIDTQIRGTPMLLTTNLDSPAGLTNLLGLQTGLPTFSLSPQAFVPGALADSMTSFGGLLFLNTGQTTLLAFLAAGAAGSYGTVIEPCSYTEKFPNPEVYFYQARGFSLAESYYLSLIAPYQGLIVAEPLAAPFARAGSGAWVGLSPPALLSGITNLTVRFDAADPTQPLHQIDLFLDGTFLQTLTNVAPAEGNVLTVTLNGQPVEYTVPANATIKSVTAALTAALNAADTTNATEVIPYGYGDRIELQSLNPARTGQEVLAAVASRAGAADTLTTSLAVSRTTFLDSPAYARIDLTVSNTAAPGDWLRLEVIKTNGARVSFSQTNGPAAPTMSDMVLHFVQAVGAHPDLQGSDGVAAEEFGTSEAHGEPQAGFTLRARTLGCSGAQIQALLSGSTNFLILPAATNHLDGNLTDLRPRNHLYVTAGMTNLTLTFALDTTALADGWHGLTAVAYEGNHARTQTRATQAVRIQNTRLAATFTSLVGDTNTALEATLQFAVTANTAEVARTELFGTGGSLGAVTGQSTAVFAVAGDELGKGLHPFYAIVTDTTGRQYRTETKYFRLVGTDAPFWLRGAGRPPTLSWPAAAGRRYDILSADDVSNPFGTAATVVPTNSVGTWTDPDPASSARYYRVRVSP